LSREKNDAIETAAAELHNTVGRRSLLRGGLIAAGAGATVPLLGAAAAGAATQKPARPARRPRNLRRAVFDVALLGNTLVIVPGPNVDFGDLRGTTYYVEGPIYPGFTIPDEQTGWDPSQHTGQEIGHWLDIGSFMSFPGRPNPHLYGTMTHIFGLITADDNFPVDQVSSVGTESSLTQDTKPSTRSIVGGAGRYFGASGQITLFGNGSNVTVSNVLGRSGPAPNLRFFFDFVDFS
jgi:hypothetical protein